MEKKDEKSFVFDSAEGNGFMNLEPKGIMRYGKTGLMCFKTGKGIFSLVRHRPFRKNKKRKRQMKKSKICERTRRNRIPFFSARKGVCRWMKMGYRVLLVVKERYL